jgi:hypothetical protein
LSYAASRAAAGTSECRSGEALDEAGRAFRRLELASIRIGGPVPAPRAKGSIAQERLRDQANQFLAIDGGHSADGTMRT